jgi:hypothetical protein
MALLVCVLMGLLVTAAHRAGHSRASFNEREGKIFPMADAADERSALEVRLQALEHQLKTHMGNDGSQITGVLRRLEKMEAAQTEGSEAVQGSPETPQFGASNKQGLRQPLVDTADAPVGSCGTIPAPGLSNNNPHPTLYDGFSVNDTTVVFLLNGAMGGGMAQAIKTDLHGGRMGTDGSGGTIPTESISFACHFPSGGVDDKPTVLLHPGHPIEFLLEAFVLCTIPAADQTIMAAQHRLPTTLSRTITCSNAARTKCPSHISEGTEFYPPVDMCPSVPVVQRNLSACLFVNLPSDLHRKGSGDFFGQKQQPLDDGVGLDLLTNWISFHVLVGFEHFYIYSTMFEQRVNPERREQILATEKKLREHMKRFGSLVTFIEWKLPVEDRFGIKSVWGPDFRWANMVQVSRLQVL